MWEDSTAAACGSPNWVPPLSPVAMHLSPAGWRRFEEPPSDVNASACMCPVLPCSKGSRTTLDTSVFSVSLSLWEIKGSRAMGNYCVEVKRKSFFDKKSLCNYTIAKGEEHVGGCTL